MDKVGAAPGTLIVKLHGTRTAFTDDLESTVGKDQVTTDSRRMVRWAARKGWELGYPRLETIEEVVEDEDTVMEGTGV